MGRKLSLRFATKVGTWVSREGLCVLKKLNWQLNNWRPSFFERVLYMWLIKKGWCFHCDCYLDFFWLPPPSCRCPEKLSWFCNFKKHLRCESKKALFKNRNAFASLAVERLIWNSKSILWAPSQTSCLNECGWSLTILGNGWDGFPPFPSQDHLSLLVHKFTFVCFIRTGIPVFQQSTCDSSF